MRALTVSAWCVAVACMTCDKANALSSEERNLLEIIVASYEANRHMPETLYLEYEKETEFVDAFPPWMGRHFTGNTNGPWKWPNHVGYAFRGEDRLFRKETVPSSAIHFTQNGREQRSAIYTEASKNNKAVQLGLKDVAEVRPNGDAYPWSLHGLSLTADLLTMGTQGCRITSVQRQTVKRRNVVVVVIDPSAEAKHDTRSILTYSEDDGYVPVRFQQSFTVASSGQEVTIDMEVTRVLTYDVNGSTFYLPGEMTEMRTCGGTTTQYWTYALNIESVKVNAELPDELFTIPINAGDRVDDKVTGVELASSHGRRSFLGLSDSEIRDEVEGITSTNDAIAADDAVGTASQTIAVGEDRPDVVPAVQDEPGQLRAAGKWVWLGMLAVSPIAALLWFRRRKKNPSS